MKYTETKVDGTNEILFNDHYVGMPYTYTDAQATDGVVRAGTIIDGKGVALYDVVIADNPNGTLVIHGFINAKKIPVQPTSAQMAALPMIMFMNKTTE